MASFFLFEIKFPFLPCLATHNSFSQTQTDFPVIIQGLLTCFQTINMQHMWEPCQVKMKGKFYYIYIYNQYYICIHIHVCVCVSEYSSILEASYGLWVAFGYPKIYLAQYENLVSKFLHSSTHRICNVSRNIMGRNTFRGAPCFGLSSVVFL